MANPWWDPSTGAMLGAILGGGLGTTCGLYGALAGTLAPRGIGRVPVLAVHTVLLAIGVALLVAAIVSIVVRQPFHAVTFCLLLPGIVITCVMGPLLPVVRMRYKQAELRRFEAEEIRRA